MPKLVVVHNPFKPSDRDILTVEACRTLADVLEDRYGAALRVEEFHVSRNGIVIDAGEAREMILGASDYIALVPRVGKGGGGKGRGGVIGIIAVIALLAMTGGSGAGLAGIFGGKMGMQLLLMGGLMMLLGKPPKIETPNVAAYEPSAFESNPAWDTGSPITIQGRPLPITYGTIRVRTPQVLSQHVSSTEDKQTLSLLMCGGEGPIDSIADFKVNEQPYTNYADITQHERRQMLSFEIPLSTSTWSDVTYLDANTEKTIFTVEFPTGLYYKASGGPITKAYVDIRIEHRVSGGPGAGWVWEDYATVRVEKAAYTVGPETRTTLTYTHPDTQAREARMRIETYSTNITRTLTVCTGAISYATTYEGMFDTRLGTNDQTVLSGFSDTFAEETVDLELDGDWTTHQLSGNADQGLEWTFNFPSGLAYYDDKGDATMSWVTIDIDYRVVGEVPWTNHKVAWKIERDKSENFKISTRVDDLAAGQYESRVRVAGQAGTGVRYVNTVKWQLLAGIIYDDFEHPGRVLVGMTALATDKLQGSIPRISWVQTRSNVYVWDPTAGGGAGAYVTKSATNPAWIVYDLIHRARYLKNIQTGSSEYLVRGDAHAKIDYSAFAAWAAFCDEIVAGEKRCVANVLVDTSDTLWAQVTRIASTGRGAIVLRGQTWSCVWDDEAVPVQLFTPGNIMVDSLTGEYTSGNDRANAVEGTFLNEERNYESDKVTVYSDTYDDEDTTSQPVRLTLTGITDYRRAVRECAYRLRLNKYLKRICSWKADVDAIACQVGDVVLLSHDLPRWGESGRVVSCNVAKTVITIDREVTLTPGKTYEIMVRLSGTDALVTKTVVVPLIETTTNEIEVSVAFSTAPVQFDLYAFGETSISSKPFRVTKITRTDDLHVEITALEYYDEIYDETVAVPTISYSTALPTISSVTGVVDFDPSGQAWLNISWNYPRDNYGGATVLVNGKMVGRVGPTESSVRTKIYEDGAYQTTVIGLTTSGLQMTKVQETLTVAALTIPIPESITCTEDTYILRDGTVITDVDVAYTIPEEGEWFPGATRRYPVQRFACVRASYQADGAGSYIDAGTFTSKTGLRLKNVKCHSSIKVKLEVVDKFDNAGAAGYSSVTALTGKSALPADVTGFTGAQDIYGILLTWTMTADLDIDVYEVRSGASWAAGTVVFSGYAERCRLNFTNSGTFTYWVKAKDTSGNYSANAATCSVVVAVPATPTATPTAINGGIKIDIAHTPNVDWDHYVIERKPTGGSWTTINSNVRSMTWMDTDIATLGYTTTYEYRVTAVDRNGATGTASTATTATAAKKIENLDITASQIVAKDFRTACDAGNGSVSGVKWSSSGIEGWNGATRNFLLDATNGTLCVQNACVSGTITATTGSIAGWCVAACCLYNGDAALCSGGVLKLGAENKAVVLSSADACYRIWGGCDTAASAPFRVDCAGALTATNATVCGAITATSGAIGGWTVATGCLCGGATALYSVGCQVLGTSNDVAVLSSCDATYRIWVGNAAAASAPFSVTKAGAIAASSGTVGGWTLGTGLICSASGCAVFCCTGLLSGGGYASGSSGWQIAANGAAEFNTLTARGAFRASVFQYQEVAAVGGQLLVANAGIVKTAVTTPAGAGSCFTLDVVDPEVGHAAQFATNDILRVQTWNGSALVTAWGTVTAVTDCTTYFRYTVKLESGTSQAIPARAAIVSYGTSAAGGGIINVGAGTCAPYIDVFTTGATPWTATTPQVRLGNLSGIAGLSGYGLYTNNGNIYGGVVRSNTFDATSGSCFGLTAGVLQLGGTGGGVSKSGMCWNGTTLGICGTINATCGTIGGWTIGSSVICTACAGMCGSAASPGDSAFWAGGTYPNNCFQVRNDGLTSIREACIYCVYGTTSNYTTASGNSACFCYLVAGTCVSAPCVYSSLGATLCCTTALSIASFGCCASGPVVCGTTCVVGCFICGVSCVCAPIICGTTVVQSPCVVGTTCVCSPVICGTTCVRTGYFCALNTSCFNDILTVKRPSANSTTQIVVCGDASTVWGRVGNFSNALWLSANYDYTGAHAYDSASLGVVRVFLYPDATTGSYFGVSFAPAGCAAPSTYFMVSQCGSCFANPTCSCSCFRAPVICGFDYGSFTRTYTGYIQRSGDDGLVTTPVVGLLMQNGTGNANGHASPSIKFDVGGGGANAQIYATRYDDLGGRIILASDNSSGSLTTRAIFYRDGLAEICGALAAATCAYSPVLCGTTCVYGCVVCGSTCVYSALVCGPNIYATTCVCSPVICSSNGHVSCGVGLAANWIGATCANGCGLVVCNGHTSGGVALYAATGSQYGTSGNFVGGSFCVELSSTSYCFTVKNLGTGTGTAIVADANGRFICQSSTRASKCCIAPWCLPSDFLDLFEPARYLYCSGLNSGSPYLVGALADDLAPWAPWAVRCDHGKPATVAYESLGVAALSGLKIERDTRIKEDVYLLKHICSLEERIAVLEGLRS